MTRAIAAWSFAVADAASESDSSIAGAAAASGADSDGAALAAGSAAAAEFSTLSPLVTGAIARRDVDRRETFHMRAIAASTAISSITSTAGDRRPAAVLGTNTRCRSSRTSAMSPSPFPDLVMGKGRRQRVQGRAKFRAGPEVGTPIVTFADRIGGGAVAGR
jgi:hypothetical protein